MRCFPQRVATGSVGVLAAAADFAADSVALDDIGAGRKMQGCILIEGYTCCGTYTASSRSKKSR